MLSPAVISMARGAAAAARATLYFLIVLAVTYVGGQVAQTTVHIPNATAGIFQAMMLFFILGSEILVRYRPRIVTTAKPAVAGE